MGYSWMGVHSWIWGARLDWGTDGGHSWMGKSLVGEIYEWGAAGFGVHRRIGGQVGGGTPGLGIAGWGHSWMGMRRWVGKESRMGSHLGGRTAGWGLDGVAQMDGEQLDTQGLWGGGTSGWGSSVGWGCTTGEGPPLPPCKYLGEMGCWVNPKSHPKWGLHGGGFLPHPTTG